MDNIDNSQNIGNNTEILVISPINRQVENTKKQLGEIFVESNVMTNDELDNLLTLQKKNEKRGVFVNIGELAINQGYIERGQLIFYLRKAGINYKLGEKLSISGELTNKQLGKVIMIQIIERKKGNNIAFGETIIKEGYMTIDELIKFMQSNNFKLNKKELLHIEHSKTKLLELEKIKQEKLEIIEIKDVHESLTNNKDGKASFLAIDMPTFHDEAEERKIENDNRVYDENQLGKMNQFNSKYIPGTHNK